MQKQQCRVLSSVLACVDGFTRRKRAAHAHGDAGGGGGGGGEGGGGGGGLANYVSIDANATMSYSDVLRQLLAFAAGLALRSTEWHNDMTATSATGAAASTDTDDTPDTSRSSEVHNRDLTGFVLLSVGAVLPLMSGRQERSLCLQQALFVLMCQIGVDPLLLLTHSERRRHIYWSTYVYLLKNQDPQSDICKAGGLYGSGLDDRKQGEGGVNITGFEKMLWNQVPGAGEARHRELILKYAAACLQEENPHAPMAPHERDTTTGQNTGNSINTQTGLARGAAIVPASALTDASLDKIFDELLSHEEATHGNRAALSIVRRHAARHGLFCDLPHSLLGSALVAYALLCGQTMHQREVGDETQVRSPCLHLPQVYSLSYLHELASGSLQPLLQTPILAKFEGLHLLVHMSKLVSAMQKGLSANNLDIFNLAGYVFVPCTALEAPRLALPPGQYTSSVGAAAATSSLAAFIAVQAKYNFECIKQRLNKERQSASGSQNSTDKQPKADPRTLLNQVENVSNLARMSSRSCDVLMLVQTCVTAIQQCASEQLAREAFDALKVQLLLFEPRSLLLLLRKMVRECPYPGMTAMLIDIGRDATQLFARGGNMLPTLATLNASQVTFSGEDAEEARMLREIQEQARQEQEREDAIFAGERGEEPEEQEKREEQARLRRELVTEDSILVHKSPWWSPLVLEAFAPPVINIGKFVIGSDIIKNLLEHNQCASLEASLSLYLFFAIRLNAARETGNHNSVEEFWGNGSFGLDHTIQKHRKLLLTAKKALNTALKATDVEDPAGDIAAVDAVSPQDCLRLQVLLMNIDRLTTLFK